MKIYTSNNDIPDKVLKHHQEKEVNRFPEKVKQDVSFFSAKMVDNLSVCPRGSPQYDMHITLSSAHALFCYNLLNYMS